ncbi:hypothetical protein JD969_05580 [Planctomycetota bacterium]|nr:hypothetical protein JD969_05580 [Planctomycetota bacterium]
MKIKVQCEHCMSVIELPKMLAGQQVKCSSCGQAIVAKEMKSGGKQDADLGGALMSDDLFKSDQMQPQQPSGQGQTNPFGVPMGGNAGGQGADQSGLMPGGMTGAGGSGGFPGAGGTADMSGKGKAKIGSRKGIAMGTTADMASNNGGDDDMQSRMERLYGIYAGEELNRGKKGKFTLGLGISLGVVLIGMVVGGKLAWDAMGEKSDDITLVDGGDDTGNSSVNLPIRSRGADSTVKWEAVGADGLSELRIERGEIYVSRELDGSAYDFELRVRPVKEDKSQYNTTMKTVLFRAVEEDGEFVQVDMQPVGKVNSVTGEYVFELHDGGFAEVQGLKNHLYYRLNVLDPDGKRLIETPVAKFPMMKMPKVRTNRVTWRPNDAGSESDEMNVLFYLDIPDWDDVLVHRISKREEIDEVVPQSQLEVPMRVMARIVVPMKADISDTGAVNWQDQMMEYQVRTIAGINGNDPVGLIPVLGDGPDVVRMLPNVKEFQNLTVEPRRDLRGQLVGQTVMFKAKSTGELEQLDLVYVGSPKQMTVVPYDNQVKVSWNGESVIATADAFEGPIAYAVYRVDRNGLRERIALLDPNVTEYQDTDVNVGERYQYEVAVVPAGSPSDDSYVKTNGWMAGFGTIPMLVKHRPTVSSGLVTTEAGLSQLNIVMGQPELVYPGTCRDAIEGMNAVVKLLREEGGVTLIDRRKAMDFYEGSDRSGMSVREVWKGTPAHLEFAFVDETTLGGTMVSLWVKDFVSGGQHKIYEAKSGEISLMDLAMAVKKYVLPLKRDGGGVAVRQTGRPENVVVEPLQIADQMRKYYGVGKLNKAIKNVLFKELDGANVVSLREAGGVEANGTMLIGGRAWLTENDGVGVSIRAIDVATGEVRGEKFIAEMNEQSIKEIGAWADGLEVVKETMQRENSVLLSKEMRVERLNVVWSQMSGAKLSWRDLPRGDLDKEVVSFGAEMPCRLEGEGVRENDDLLSRVKPYVSVWCPQTFDAWTGMYAKYLEADYKGFENGYKKLTRLEDGVQGSDVKLFVRGRVVGDGGSVNMGGKARITERDVVLGSVLPGNGKRNGVLDYWRELSQRFEDEPYVCSEAWGKVDDKVARAFLKGVMHRVQHGRYGTLEKRLKRPPTLARYVAAKKLFGMKDRESYDFIKEVARVCTFVQKNFDKADNPNERLLVQNAILILVYEKDATTIKLLDNKSRRRQFFERGEVNADMMRMFVDASEKAWEWDEAEFLAGVDWREFKWKSVDEMRMITDEKPELFTREHYERMREWLGAPMVNGYVSFRRSYPEKTEAVVVEEVTENGTAVERVEPEEESENSFDFLKRR